MGNCSPKPITRSEYPPKPKTRSPSPDPIRLHGCDSCPVAARIRIALLYKSIPVDLVPLPNPLNRPFLQLGSETLDAPADSLLRCIDARFAGAPEAAVEWEQGTMEAAAAAVRLQHRSMERHAAALERWARDLVAGKRGIGGKGRGIGDWYGKAMEMMLEHAQMEETFLFPLLDRAADFGEFLIKLNFSFLGYFFLIKLKFFFLGFFFFILIWSKIVQWSLNCSEF